jgi:hypothetical protein
MIRLTWRQFRTQAAIALGAVIALGVVAVLTRGNLVHIYNTTVAGCSKRGNCNTAISNFLDTDRDLRGWLGILVLVTPGLVGVFWGSTLVTRELETGTFRLAWTQSITRTRWLAVKLAVLGLASMVTAGLVSLIVTWWASPLDRAGQDRFATFDWRGIVPIGHAAFAFMLGVTLGVVIRKMLPAMAATLVSFVAIRLAFATWVRPHLITPLTGTSPLTAGGMGFGSRDGGPMTLMPDPPRMPNAWIYSSRIVNGAGHDLPKATLRRLCPLLGQGLPAPDGGPGSGPTKAQVPKGAVDSMQQCITTLSRSYHKLFTYQPAHRYWPLQWIELGVYVAAALVLAGLCVWWVRRRLA